MPLISDVSAFYVTLTFQTYSVEMAAWFFELRENKAFVFVGESRLTKINGDPYTHVVSVERGRTGDQIKVIFNVDRLLLSVSLPVRL